MIFAIPIFALTLAGKLLFDRHLHFSRKTIKHAGEAAIVLGLLVVASFLAAGGFKINAGFYLIAFLFIFWAAFDSIFGLIIASNPLFLGTSAKLDRLQHKYKWIVWVKYIGAILSILWFLLPYFIKLPI